MSNMIDYKCPACGGALEFDAATQKMKCPFCDSIFEMDELLAKDEELNDNDSVSEDASETSYEASAEILNNDETGEENIEEAVEGWQHPKTRWDNKEVEKMVVYACKSCGGEIVGDGNTGATQCPYCGNPIVLTGSFKGDLKPDYIIPFKLDKKKAKEVYGEYIQGKYLLPKQFKDENHIDEIKGIYVPFWLYDCKVDADAVYKAEKVRAWSDSRYNYEEVSFFDVSRSGSMEFSNIPCDGSSQMEDALMESIEPFEFSKAVPFQSAYMAGYFADIYDVDSRDNEARIDERIRQSAIEVLKGTINDGYSMIHNPEEGAANIRIKQGKVKYALYPVWMLTTTYRGERFTFAMNGQTGKFVGNLPVDKGRKNALFGGIAAGITAIWSALMYLIFG